MRGVAAGVRALVVGPIEGGSLPIARYAADALAGAGVATRRLDFSWLAPPAAFGEDGRRPEALVHLVAYASRLVEIEAERFRPDLVLVLAQAPIAPETVGALRAAGATTAYWFVENYRVTTYWSRIAPLYDWFFTLQRGRFHEALRAAGARRIGWLPLACDPARHRRVRLGRAERRRLGAAVGIAGYGYYNRRELLAGIADFRPKVWGPGWASSALAPFVQDEGRPFDEATMLRIAAAFDVHVNLHSATHVPGVDPEGDYLNPRTFELASCGAFQLVDARRDLAEHFEPGKEIVTFGDLEELRDKLAYFLRRPDERRRIARRARRRARAEHTYRHRIERLLASVLGAAPRRPAPSLDAAVLPETAAALAAAPTMAPRELLERWSARSECTDEEILLRLALGGAS